MVFCGHLGDNLMLDAVALAITGISSCCLSVAQGLGTACDTYFAQTLVIVNVWIGVAANGINALLHFMLLDVWHLGLDGSALALMLSYVSMFVMTLVYIIISKTYTATWGGIIGTTDLAVQSVLMQMDNLWVQISNGLQIACAIRLGQCLGAKNLTGAQICARICIVLIATVSLLCFILVVSLHKQLPLIFTNVKEYIHREVSELAADLLSIVAAYILFDGVANVCKGVLSGTGRQAMAAAVLFTIYYVIALPISVCLMFPVNLGVGGYWLGLAVALFLAMLVFLAIVYRTDWARRADEAMERVGILGTITKNVNDGNELDEKTSVGEKVKTREIASTFGAFREEPRSVISNGMLARRLIASLTTVVILVVSIIMRLSTNLPDPFNVSYLNTTTDFPLIVANKST
ncbi:hypothetical protein CAPTEDRAFT_201272 [Capitella teleta]|uniref:Multidrug and toxin extrusion protein n=1 Tax=Capitella teleta TaxID=283909 RepID=R7VAH1_CAPTE|nr:hypothetical protein CAPTEDRAFT_201272 [Capitella teleta]|eukprot:ELU15609.1 hypothetical protein CAPTEDRAFT_201272 [Capitella teleta]